MPDTIAPPPVAAQAGVAGQSPAQGTGATDWGSVVARYDGLKGQSANSNMVAASGVNPDHAAIARTLSPVLGIAPSVIEADPQTYSTMFALRSDRATVARDPVLQAWMAANPDHAKVSQGDMQNLGFFGAAMSAWRQSALGEQMNWIGVDQGDGQVRPSELNTLQTDREKLAVLQARQPPVSPGAPVPDAGLSAIRYPGRMVTPPITSAAGMGAFFGSNAQGLVAGVPATLVNAAGGAAIGAVTTGPAGIIPGAVVGGVRGFAAYEGAQAYGQVYRQTSDITDQTGKPIPEATRQIVSVGAGLITAALNTVGGGEISAPVKAGLSKLATDAATKLAADPVAARALSSFGARMAKAGLVGAAVNGGQAAAQLLAPQIAQAISMPGADTVFSDPAKRAALVDQIVQQAKIGLIAFPTFEAGLHGVSLLGGGMKAEAALDQAGGFDQAMDAAHASKTRGRAADALQTLAAAHVAAGGPDTLYVPGDAAMALYQRLGTTPGAPDDPFRFVPDMRDQLEQAQATGGDVQIPMADYAAHVPADVDQALRSSGQVRFAPDGMTAAEAAEFHAQHAGSLDADPAFMQSLADELSKSGEDRDDKLAVYEHFHDQLRQAGYTDDPAHTMAALVAANYATRGADLGVSPRELYEADGVRVQRVSAAPRIEPDMMDRVLDSIRLGSKLPTDRELHGPSLAEFLSYPPRKGKTQEQLMHMTAEARAKPGGLRDPDGDLAAMDAHLWHKAEPFRNRLIHKDGMSPDDAALHAWQHGYFPDHTERPDINELHEALRRELGGKPVYRRLHPADEAKRDFRDTVDQVQRVLDQEGIDPHEASNEEIKAALDRHATEATLMQGAPPEPVARLKGDEIAPHDADIETLRKAAAAFYDRELRDKGASKTSIGDVQFAKRGRKKLLSNSVDPEKLRMVAALRAIIEKGEHEGRFDLKKPRKDGVVAFHQFVGNVDLGGKIHRVRVFVYEDEAGNKFYDLQRNEEGGARSRNSIHGPATPFRDDPELFQGVGPSASNPRVGRESHAADVGQKSDGINLSLSQPGTDDVRGSITIGQGVRMIRVFRHGNLSTVPHELGHMFIDNLLRDADRENAPADYRERAAFIRKFVGAKEGEALTAEQHEKLMNPWEGYLMTGKAPVPELVGVFQKFNAWLTRIYRSIVALGGAVNPKLAAVFDRLLATEDAIEQARSGLGLRDPLFKTPADAGMSIDEWHRYQRAMRGAKDVAYDKVLRRAMKVERDRATAEWKRASDEARPGVEAAVKARPVLRAWSHLATGRDISDPDAEPMRLKLDRAAVEGILHGSIERLPHGVIGADGMHPDAVAPVFGYESGEQMLDDLISENGARAAMAEQAGNPVSFKKYVASLVDQGTDEAVRAKLGDVLSDGGIEEAALQAAHNVTQADVLTMEMRAAANKAGVPHPMQLRHLKAYVAGKLADMRIGDATRVAAYRRAEAKGGRDAERALLGGKPAEAFQAKQRQLMAHLYATRAQEIAADWDRAMTYWRGIAKQATRAGVDQGFMDQAHGVLARLGMTPARDAGELARGLEGKPLDRFIEDQAALGYEMVVPDFIRAGAALPHYTDLTADQFQGAADAVRSIMHNGRAALAVTLDGKRVALDDLVNEAVDRLDEKPSLPKGSLLHADRAAGIEGALYAASHAGRVIDANLVKPEQFMHELDGEQDVGPFQALFDRIKQAGYDERDMQGRVAAQISEITEGLQKDWGKRLKDQVANHDLIDPDTGKPAGITRDMMLGIALNTGNASNLDKLTRGYGWDEAGVMRFLHRNMTKDDWHVVQGIWKVFEGLFPDIEAMHRRVTGVGLNKLEHTPIDTQFGKIEGGYFPIVYDATRSPTPEGSARGGDLFDRDQYFRATTPKGHTIARTGYAAPLRLSIGNTGWLLHRAIHDLTHREAIMDGWKVVNDKRITASIRDKMGSEYVKVLPDFLRDVANNANEDDKMVGWVAKLLNNATAVGIGFNIHTIERHGLTALSNSISTVGAKDFLLAAREFRNPARARATSEWVMRRSGEMRHRFEKIDSDVRHQLLRLQGDHSAMQNVIRWSYYPVSALDFASAMPTWLAAYRRGMADGMEDGEAVRHAGRATRMAHGGSHLEDMSAFQRKARRNMIYKAGALFYNFAAHMYNQGLRYAVRGTVSAVRHVKEGDYVGARRDMVAVAGRSFSYMVMPGLISALVANQGYETVYGGQEPWWKEIGGAILGEAAAGVPYLRDVASAAIEGRDLELTPLGQIFNEGRWTADDVLRATGASDKPVSQHWIEHAADTAGYATGLPLGQPGRSAQYLWDIGDGTVDNQSLGQFMHGLIYGPPPVKK